MTILCDLYLRLSDGRNENGSFTDREAKLRNKASQLGWTVHRVVVENDVMGAKSASAFKRRKIKLADGSTVMRVIRPGFMSMLEDLKHGTAQAILAEDLDRTMRDPRDAEDLIDIIRATRGWADSLSGSLKLTAGGTDAELLQARVLVAVAQKSSQDTARRVAAGRERKASKGEWGGGVRPYGYCPDGTTVDEAEAAEIRHAADQILAGIALKAVARDLIARKVPTVTGVHWKASTLRDVLLRPRNAGIVVHGGQETDARYPGDPILQEDIWRAVVAKLSDPSRSQPGRAACWLGSNIYRCVCGSVMEFQGGTNRAPSYKCKREGGTGDVHVRRNAAQLDSFVTDLIQARLSQADTSAMFVKPSTGMDAKELRLQAAALKEIMGELARDRAEGLITRDQMLEATRTSKAKLEAIEAQLAAATDRSPLEGIAGAEDVGQAWEQMSLGQQREVLKLLMTITVFPVKRRGGPGFDPDAVQVVWRTGE